MKPTTDRCRVEDTAHTFWQGYLVVTSKVSWPTGNDLGAKHDTLLTEQANRAEGAVEIMMVDVRWNAVLRFIHIDNGCVGLLSLWQNTPPASPYSHHCNGVHCASALHDSMLLTNCCNCCSTNNKPDTTHAAALSGHNAACPLS